MIREVFAKIAEIVTIAGMGEAKPIRNRVVVISASEKEPEKQLTGLLDRVKKAGSGHYAFLLFSADWCGGCRQYEPSFYKQARESDGKNLYIETSNEKLIDLYGITGIPAVLIFDSLGGVSRVEDLGVELEKVAEARNGVDQYLDNPGASLDKQTDRKKTTRYGIMFMGTSATADAVTLKEFGIVRDLTNTWLKFGYDHIFLLMYANNIWQDDKRVSVLTPTNASLKQVVGAMILAGLDDNDRVDINVLGHGDGRGMGHYLGNEVYTSDFVSVMNRIPPPVSRVMRLTPCRGASFLEFSGVRDDNDLVVAYSGKRLETIMEGEGVKSSPEDNFLDTRDLGVLYAGDVDGDGITANWEMFWEGMTWSTIVRELPFTRGFVYDPGPRFIDMGFGTEPAKKPFSSDVKEISNISDYVELLGTGIKRGILVVGYNMSKEEESQVPAELTRLAQEYNGWTQFAFLDKKTAANALAYEGVWIEKLDKPVFKIFFVGSNEMGYKDKLFDLEAMVTELADLRRGKHVVETE